MNDDITTIMAEIDRLPHKANSFGNYSTWVEDLECSSLYVRYSTRRFICDGPVLTIANISVAKPGEGFFTSLLKCLKAKCLEENYSLEVESVLNPRFAEKLKSLGFQYIPDTNPPSFLWRYA